MKCGVCVHTTVYVSLAPSLGGAPPLRASASATVFVNLLDLNDNDPTFVNLPFVAEVPEGLPINSSVYKVFDVNSYLQPEKWKTHDMIVVFNK